MKRTERQLCNFLWEPSEATSFNLSRSIVSSDNKVSYTYGWEQSISAVVSEYRLCRSGSKYDILMLPDLEMGKSNKTSLIYLRVFTFC